MFIEVLVRECFGDLNRARSLRICDQRIPPTSAPYGRCPRQCPCIHHCHSLLEGNSLRVLASRLERHPATVLFVYSTCLPLPELLACLYLGLWVTHLQPPQQTHCCEQLGFPLKMLTPGKPKGKSTEEVLAGESGHFTPLLVIRSPSHQSPPPTAVGD